MELPQIDAIASGLSATLIVATGYLIGIRLAFVMRHRESKLLYAQILFALTLGSYYLGTVVSFWLLFFTGSNIEPLGIAAILCFTVAPIGVCVAMYIGFSMIKPRLVKPMIIILAITAIPYWANLWFGWPDPGYSAPDPGPGHLVDIELLSLSELFTTVYILVLMLFFAGGFIYLAKISTGDIRRRSSLYATGTLIFSAVGIIESRVPLQTMGLLGDWLLVMIRIFMVMAFLILYKAMIPTKH